MTKEFLKDNEVEFEFVDVDLLEGEDKRQAHAAITSKGGVLSYPTVIVDDKVLITGFQKNKIQEALGL